MLAVGRTLSRNPKVLLADELSLGLAPMVVDRLLDAVRQAARERGWRSCSSSSTSLRSSATPIVCT